MNLLESFWFLVAFLLIIIVLLTDPKSSTGANSNPMIGKMFSGPRSGQKFVYQLSGLLVTIFLILTVINYSL